MVLCSMFDIRGHSRTMQHSKGTEKEKTTKRKQKRSFLHEKCALYLEAVSADCILPVLWAVETVSAFHWLPNSNTQNPHRLMTA